MYFYAPNEVPSVALQRGCLVSILGDETTHWQFSHFYTAVIERIDSNGNISLKNVEIGRSLAQSEQKEVNFRSELHADLNEGVLILPANYIWNSKLP